MKIIFKFYQRIRLLSLDIVGGTLASSLLASILFDVTPPTAYWISLFLVVWIIYLTDHLIDSYQSLINNDVRSDFFHSNRQFFWKFISVLFIVSVIFIQRLPLNILYFGVTGGVFIIIYLVINQVQNRKNIFIIPKEILISVIYIYGTWGVPVLMSDHSVDLLKTLLIISYFLLVLTNVLIFSYFDYEKDEQNVILTLAVKFGKSAVRMFALCMVILSIVLYAYLYIIYTGIEWFYIFPGVLIAIILTVILLFPHLFRKNELYGIIADASFFLPFSILILK
ncbi:MAG: hypothetical protein JW894_14575 [Bacteroidales bacterium]|nr:hypothetical protein [Bacteroidales bacterium]